MYVDVDSEKIFYKEYGKKGKTFLLLHNAGGSHRFFDPQISCLKELGKVIVLDLPGHGRSLSDKSISVENNALSVIAFCEKLGLCNIHGVGLNYGANIFLEVAARSVLISSLVMIDPPMFFLVKWKD